MKSNPVERLDTKYRELGASPVTVATFDLLFKCVIKLYSISVE